MGSPATAHHYVGRFAPTPSGPLHLGSLLTAIASWVDARAHGGVWRLRIDDLDEPRVVRGAESAILRSLEAHGLGWDGRICRQSGQAERYRAALASLGDRCFACRCTRRDLRGHARYPGTCRLLGLPRTGNAVRLRVEAGEVGFVDRIQGPYAEDLAETVGDFAVWRRDGLASYQLAVVADDANLGITHIVRGADLLDNTPRQRYLAELLGFAPASYAHVPVVAEASGVKLSKHNRATAIDDRASRQNVAAALCLLGLDPPPASAPEMLDWAHRHWRIDNVPKRAVMPGFVALA